MYKDFQGVKKLIHDLQKEDLLEDYVINDDLIRLNTSKLLLLVYLPASKRLEEEVDKKTIHLDIDVLNNSYSKVLQRLKGLMGRGRRVYARETVVARVDKKVTLDFLEEYHLNTPLAGKYRYGLYYKGELLSVAVFSGGRNMRNIGAGYRSFEMLRFCHKADFLVTGGVSKLVKAFVKDFKPNDIMTYADRDWGLRSSLEAIGFQEEGITAAQIFHIKDGKRIAFDDSIEDYDYSVKNKGSIKLKFYP